MTRVLVPWHDIAAHAAGGALPEGLSVEVYDGVSAPPEDVSDVEFYVVPYDRGAEPIELVRRMPRVAAVQSLMAGVEKIAPLVADGTVLASGRGLHDLSTAEHALSLVLGAQRELPRWIRQQPTGSWAREHTRSLADSRVLLVGHGSIGAAIERYLLAGEAVVTPVASRARPDEGVRGVDELDALLPAADIVVLVLPDTPATRGILGAERLAALPDAALVVNVGRGTAIDTDALLGEARTGRLRAALDVTDPEPLPADHPLWTTEGVIITPHIAGGSDSFYPRAKRLIAEQLHRFAAGEPLRNVVG